MTRTRHAMAMLPLAAALAGCSEPVPLPPKNANRPLVPWTGRYQALFDDGIDPAAVGMSLDGASPASEPLLRQRAQSADLVARMLLKTVSREGNGERTHYVLTMLVGHPTLAQPRWDADVLELAVEQGTSAYQLVSANERAFDGRKFIGFVRRFAANGAPEVRWHLTADTPEVAQAVDVAATLLGGSSN